MEIAVTSVVSKLYYCITNTNCASDSEEFENIVADELAYKESVHNIHLQFLL